MELLAEFLLELEIKNGHAAKSTAEGSPRSHGLWVFWRSASARMAENVFSGRDEASFVAPAATAPDLNMRSDQKNWRNCGRRAFNVAQKDLTQ
jgi:hypothetical protein